MLNQDLFLIEYLYRRYGYKYFFRDAADNLYASLYPPTAFINGIFQSPSNGSVRPLFSACLQSIAAGKCYKCITKETINLSDIPKPSRGRSCPKFFHDEEVKYDKY